MTEQHMRSGARFRSFTRIIGREFPDYAPIRTGAG